MPDYAYGCLTLSADILELVRIFKSVLFVLQIGVLVALIIWLIIDIFKTITSGEVDTSKLFKSITKRVMAAVLVFLVPLVVDTVLGFAETNQKYISYYNCAEDDIITEIYINNADVAMTEFIYNPNYLTYTEAKQAVNRIKNDNHFNDKDYYLSIIKQYEESLKNDQQPNFAGIDISNNPGSSIDVSSDVDVLSSLQINKTLNSLPSNISDERKEIVRVALEAVGKIPYYWGGTASYPGYDNNNFGSTISADNNGRTKKGLDCSHFVDWVYWTAVGNNLGNGWTGHLWDISDEIDSADLLPGDIVFTNPGSSLDNHIGIYVGRNQENQLLVVHETAGTINNVAFNVRTWSYFRRIKSDVINLDNNSSNGAASELY